MVAIAQSRLSQGLAIVGDALHLMVADHAFDRVLTGHFYGHLPTDERATFLAEARRVAGELIVIDSAPRPEVDTEQWQERVLNDGSRHQVYKRYLSGDQLADEIGGQKLLDGSWFVGSLVRRRPCVVGNQHLRTRPQTIRGSIEFRSRTGGFRLVEVRLARLTRISQTGVVPR